MQWKPVPGFDGIECTAEGEFRSWLKSGPKGGRRDTPKLLKPALQLTGYRNIYFRGKRYGCHRLMLMTHVGPPPSGIHQAAHLNGVRDDNRLANLEWKTPKENDRDKDVHGTRQDQKRLTAEQIAEIRATPPVMGEHTAEKLGQKYGVSDSCIRYVWRGNADYPLNASSA